MIRPTILAIVLFCTTGFCRSVVHGQVLEVGARMRASLDDTGTGTGLADGYRGVGALLRVRLDRIALGATYDRTEIGVTCLAIEECEATSGDMVGATLGFLLLRSGAPARTFGLWADAGVTRLIRSGIDYWVLPYGLRGDMRLYGRALVSAELGRIDPPFVGDQWYVGLGIGIELPRR